MNVKKLSLGVIAGLAILSAPAYAITDGERTDALVNAEAPAYEISTSEYQQIESFVNANENDNLYTLVEKLGLEFPHIPDMQLFATLLELLPKLPSASVVVVGAMDLFPNLSAADAVSVVLEKMPGSEGQVIQAAMTVAPTEVDAIAKAALEAGVSADTIIMAALAVNPSLDIDIAAVQAAIDAQTAYGDAVTDAAVEDAIALTEDSAPAAGGTVRASFSGRGSGVSPN